MTSTFTDTRDGNVYKIINLNGQVWLAENLRYKGVEHYAPNGDEENIPEYGCLYTWNNAIKACPEGWHLPSKEEFEELLLAAGSDKAERFIALIAQSWNGDDSLGFKALPAGDYFYGHSGLDLFGDDAYFWSASEHSFCDAYYMGLEGLGYESAKVYNFKKTYGFSVRCIKD